MLQIVLTINEIKDQYRTNIPCPRHYNFVPDFCFWYKCYVIFCCCINDLLLLMILLFLVVISRDFKFFKALGQSIVLLGLVHSTKAEPSPAHSVNFLMAVA